MFQVGHLILGAAAKSNLKRVSLELGGKSPVVIFDDADGSYRLQCTIIKFSNFISIFIILSTVDEAAGIAHTALFDNHGQSCCAGSRTFVQAGIYDAFVAKAKALAESKKVGDPFSPEVEQGPQVDGDQLRKITELVESGKKQGATLQTGGLRIGDVGFFFKVCRTMMMCSLFLYLFLRLFNSPLCSRMSPMT